MPHPHDDRSTTSTAPVGAAGPAPRDRSLDLLRAAALIRVVVWHATGAAVVTLVAAMPVPRAAGLPPVSASRCSVITPRSAPAS